MWNDHLGSIKTVQHRIELERTNSQTIHPATYRSNTKAREFKNQEIGRMLNLDDIEPAPLEWALPIFFVPKQYGTPCICVDYPKLNAVRIWNLYPTPCLDEYTDLLGDAMIFSTLRR